jgi:hypothetical protein
MVASNNCQVAGSAEQFKKVDYEYVAAAATAAKAAGVPYFGLVSAQGANANVPASDFRLLHPLLYTQTKGKVCCVWPLGLLAWRQG